MDSYIVGIIVGVALVFLLAVIIGVFAGRSGTVLDGFSEKSYDERQQRARVKAFKAGFFTLLCYNALYAMTTALFGVWCDVPTGCFIGIAIGVAVFAVVCIMNDAYFTLKENPRKITVLFVIIMLANLLPGLVFIFDKEESVIENGVLNFHCINLLMVALFLVIFAALLIKRARDKREAGDE